MAVYEGFVYQTTATILCLRCGSGAIRKTFKYFTHDGSWEVGSRIDCKQCTKNEETTK